MEQEDLTTLRTATGAVRNGEAWGDWDFPRPLKTGCSPRESRETERFEELRI
jgi:hypothetical protein